MTFMLTGWAPFPTPHRCANVELRLADSTGQNKSKEIRDLLRMGRLSPEWTLPSRLAGNPMVWLVQVNGFIIDIRDAAVEFQRAAFERGLIPYVLTDRQEPEP